MSIGGVVQSFQACMIGIGVRPEGDPPEDGDGELRTRALMRRRLG